MSQQHDKSPALSLEDQAMNGTIGPHRSRGRRRGGGVVSRVGAYIEL